MRDEEGWRGEMKMFRKEEVLEHEVVGFGGDRTMLDGEDG